MLDTVAPPLSDEEIVEIWLSKSQLGYLGLEQITYRAWSSVLEQTATGDVVVQTDQNGGKNDTDGGAFTITLHEGLAKAKEAAKVCCYIKRKLKKFFICAGCIVHLWGGGGSYRQRYDPVCVCYGILTDPLLD